MTYFSSADEVYDTLGRLMQDAAVSGGLGPQLQQTTASVQLAMSDPESTITMMCSEGQDPVVEFGPGTESPTLTLEMSADTAHEIFLGVLNLFDAVDRGRLTLGGAGRDFLAIWPAAEFALPARYAQILDVTGHGEIAQAS